MMSEEKNIIVKITEPIYQILEGKTPSLVELSEDYTDNEVRQRVGYINRFVKEYNDYAESMHSLSIGELGMTPSKGKMRVAHSFKSLQSNLRHLTWKTQQIANGDFNQEVDFMGDFSKAFNKMSILKLIENSKLITPLFMLDC